MKKMLAMLGMLLVGGSTYATTNEITVNASLKVNKNSTQLQKSSGTQLIQMAGNKIYTVVVNATTSPTYLSKGSIGNMGWCYMRNLSTNNTVYLSLNQGVTTNMSFLYSEAGVFRFAPTFNPTNITVSTTSGTADFEFTAVEE